ncbi:MAG: peptidase, partial [Saprospiraceae bacterium]|nr:peptidase [Saprospiraceae bacterium]
MTEIIPLFPLKLVCFPGETLNLHIFEERYKTLIQDVQRDQKNFGIPPVQNDALYPLGAEIELMSIAHT